jgi:hypothetical protein
MFPSKVLAQGNVIVVGSIDELLWSIVKTIQYYSLPVMALTLAGLGIKLVSSGDDTQVKNVVKSWMIKILAGGVMNLNLSSMNYILHLQS